MDDSNPLIPFDFEDCDAFLASLDENSTSLMNQKSPQDILHQNPSPSPSNTSQPIQSPITSDTMSNSSQSTQQIIPDYASEWSRLQNDPYNTVQQQQQQQQQQQMNPFTSPSMSSFSLQQQQQQPLQHNQMTQNDLSNINNGGYSSHSTPLSSPLSVSPESENMVTFFPNVLYSNLNTTTANTTPSSISFSTQPQMPTMAATNSTSGYPITPPYPSGGASSMADVDSMSPGTANPADYANMTNPNNNSNSSFDYTSLNSALPLQQQLLQPSQQQQQQQNSPLNNNNLQSPTNINNIQLNYNDDLNNNNNNNISPVVKNEDYSPSPISPRDGSTNSSPNGYQDVKSSPNATSPSGKATKMSQRKDRQHSTTKNDAKGKVTKPKKEKTSHNMIEKRYRTNINDKILALRDCVPSLRCVVDGSPRSTEDLEGLTPASKLNKATVLTKATEYILHLQKRNAMLVKQLSELRNDQTDMSGSLLPNDMASTAAMPSNLPTFPSLTQQQQQQQGAAPNQNQQPMQGQMMNNFASKVMMCSMAGLMGAGLMNEGNADNRGLSALPILSFLCNFNMGSWDVTSLFFALKMSFVFAAALYFFSPLINSFLYSDEPNQKTQTNSMTYTDSIELSDIRKQSWINNAKTFGLLPYSSSISSVVKSCVKFIVIYFMGSDFYQLISRRKSLSEVSLYRAIDAQLCGGDVECTRGSLFNSFVESFNFGSVPSRSLTQAIQIQVLSYNLPGASFVANKLSNYFLTKAKKDALYAAYDNEDENEKSEQESATPLPDHIISLLECPDLFNERIVQRLYNVAFNRPVSEGCPLGDDDEGYHSVITDKSISSVHDVLSALYANSLLHDVLLGVLENDEIDFTKLETCAKVAPPRSIVARRIAIAEALLLGNKDACYAKNAMEMLKEELNQQAWINKEISRPDTATASTTAPESGRALSAVEESSEEDETVLASDDSSILEEEYITDSDVSSIFTNKDDDTVAFLATSIKSSMIPFAVSQDSRLGIRFSLIRCYLARNLTGPAFQLLQKVEINKLESIGLLGFVAMWKVLNEMYERKYTASRHKLEDLSAIARIWLGGNIGAEEGLSLDRLRYLVGESVNMSKFFGGFESEMDEGYVSNR